MTASQTNSKQIILTSVCASVVTAILLAIAMPGRLGWWPLLFVALVPLLLFIIHNKPGRSFVAGFIAGFVYHVCLLYWIVIVLGKYGGVPFLIAVGAMLLLAAYMGLYSGVFSLLLCHGLGRKKNLPLIMIFAPILWVALDWLRGKLFTGFPWMDLGYGLYSNPLLVQVADLGGHHLVSFCIVLVNSLLVFLLCRGRFEDRKADKKGIHIALTACLIVIAAGLYSFFRYQQVAEIASKSKHETVAVVQGNIPQDEKWTPSRKQSTLRIYRELSEKGVWDGKAGLVVWPETALPFYPDNNPLFFDVTGFAREQAVWLLTGSPYYTINTTPPGREANRKDFNYFNSALLINPDGEITDRYSKQHLVPFGEYVPLQKYLPFLEPLVVHVGDFSRGTSSKPLDLSGKNVKAGVLICYESIFPDLARKQARAGANIMVNLTNDAWYGRSSAPWQSFAMSVLRAVETRRSLVRAANTGISGFVDPQGNILKASPIFEPLVMTEYVAIVEQNTFFAKFGFLFGPFCLVLVPFLFWVTRKERNY